MKLVLKYKLTLAGIAIGAIAGYAYYHFAACTSGSCPITSQPVNSTAYGALMGALLFSGFKKDTTNKEHENEQQ